jgi:hypothetical protein
MKDLGGDNLISGYWFVGVHVTWVPCHHGMARPQVEDGGDGLRIWWVTANILNKQSQAADMGPPAWGLGVGLTNTHRKKVSLLRNITKGLGHGRIIWTNDLS